MLIITALFLLIPLLLKIPFVSCVVSWLMDGFKISDYKSAYLEVLGGIAGSWLAITGAIYTQRKFDDEKEKQSQIAETRKKIENKENIKVICKEMLWSEIHQNDNALRFDNNTFLIAIRERRANYHYSVKHYRVTLDNWKFIRDKVIEMDMDLAIKLMNLYKYYEFIVDFEGNAKEAREKSQLDFEQYVDCYKAVVYYLQFPWEV